VVKRRRNRSDRYVVSILLVNFRAYAELTACLASLAPFVGDDHEVIVVDHATNRDAASAMRRQFPWVHLIGIAENPGFAAGVNRAAQAASGTYLLLLNPDCAVTTDIARPMAGWLASHPHVGACGALVREPNGSIQASARRFPDLTTGLAGRTSWLSRRWPGNPWTRRNLSPSDEGGSPRIVDWVTGACMMIRREAFDAVGGMDEQFFMYWEDADFCFRLARAGWLTIYNPRVEVLHLTGRSSAHARRAALIAFHRSAYRYFRKHSGRAAKVFAPCVYLILHARLLLRLAALRLGGPAAPVVPS
jgi:N-acetylglucosaminyl-diphospho-decaprenol L-rhamnosyltransferase